MALFISKPVMWNDKGYVRPAGCPTKGEAGSLGYGHEEWNNSPKMSFMKDGVLTRVFHTEEVGNAPVNDEAGRIFVFMYATHGRVHKLVGIAGNATCLIPRAPEERARLAKKLNLNRLADEAWSLDGVKKRARKHAVFLKKWNDRLHWIPNWHCPADMFLWLDQPVQLDPQQLRNKSKLLTMFKKHTNIEQSEAIAMLGAVPRPQRSAAWHRIRAEIIGPGSKTLNDDLSAIDRMKGISETTRKQLIDARVGQGVFREKLVKYWGKACAVSNISMPDVLRASHIKRWADSNNDERLDGNNGLLLTANLDALFEHGHISFDDKGKMMISRSTLTGADRKQLELSGMLRPRKLRKAPNAAQKHYLSQHRQRWNYPD